MESIQGNPKCWGSVLNGFLVTTGFPKRSLIFPSYEEELFSRCVPLLGQRLIEWPTSHQCESRNGELPWDSIPHSFSVLIQLAGGAHIDVDINAPGQFRGQGSSSTWTHGDGAASPGQHDAPSFSYVGRCPRLGPDAERLMFPGNFFPELSVV